MKTTLYQRLRKTDNLNEGLSKHIKTFNDGLKGFVDLEGFQDVSIKTPEVDISRIQRRAFENYATNEILNSAIYGERPIEKSVEELSSHLRGISKILPHRKDKQHNARVKELGQLVGYTRNLEKSGLFVPDNIVTIPTYMTTLSFGIGYFLSGYLFKPDTDPEMINAYQTILPTAMSILFSTFGTLGLISELRTIPRSLKEQAKYIDDKIEKLF